VRKALPFGGRSFHNSRFVHQLRRCALAEPLVSIYSGRVTRLVCASDFRGEHAGSAGPLSPPVKPRLRPPTPGGPLPTRASPARYQSCSDTVSAAHRNSERAGGSVPGSGGGGSSRVVRRVLDRRTRARERVSRAPLTVVCDGRYSILRGSLSSAQPKTMSFMAGLLLRHSTVAGPNGILPTPAEATSSLQTQA